MRCHNQRAGVNLGINTLQLNRDSHYGHVTDNQLNVMNQTPRAWSAVNEAAGVDAMEWIGMFLPEPLST